MIRQVPDPAGVDPEREPPLSAIGDGLVSDGCEPRTTNGKVMAARKIARQSDELRKQVSIFLPASQWRKVRREAARRDVAITVMVAEWIKPHLDAIPDEPIED